MAVSSWTREENERFKTAVQLFSAFVLTRFEKIAEYVHKPVADVKAHYEGLVDDLLEIGSCLEGVPDELTEAMAHNWYPVQRAIWYKDEHEWFLIGLKRFKRDWEKIADLVDSKNPVQVAVYAYHYYHWQNSKKRVMKKQRVSGITMNVDLMGYQGSLVQSELEPPQEPMVLDID